MEQKYDSIVDPNVEMYDSYYQKPDWWFRFRYDTQVKRKTCLHLLKQVGRTLANQRVLEIGFGSGAVLFSFEANSEIYGIEISRSAIERAARIAQKKGYKAFEFQKAIGSTLPYPDDAFDILFASHVIEHVQDDKKLLAEIRRVLKPRGVALVLIPINENYDDPNHIHHYTGSRFAELAEECSLQVLYQLENELLFHLVEKFYFEEYNYRWKIFGPLIAALFNFPTAVLPFWIYQILDRVMLSPGWKPRQFGCVLVRPETGTNVRE